MQFSDSSRSFVGREKELAKIADLLAMSDCRLLTLTGPGGIGKTRLAIEAMTRQTDNFADGVYFVALAPINSLDSLVPTIANTIGFQFFEGNNPVQRLLDYLHDKNVLLVLDNFEHLMDAADLLPQLLEAAPNVHLLVTSRERLNLVEEWVLAVGGLPFPAGEGETEIEDYGAVRLFIQAANRLQVGFTLDASQSASVNRICRMVGGMPLALELAAAWVRALSCDAIADEIARSLDVLETSARNMPLRHRTIRAAFDPTWERLSNTEREVFTRLSVFRGGFTREAAEVVAGATRQTLAALSDKSLLHIDATGRYSLHELLRQYGEEQLNLSGNAETTRDAHSSYYARFLREKWGPLRTAQQVKTLDEIGAEFENTRAAWRRMIERCNSEALSLAVYSIWYYADLRGRYLDILPLFQQAQDALQSIAGDETANRAIGQLLTRRGHLYISLGRAAEGLVLAEEGLAILEQMDCLEDIFWALDSVAMIINMIGENAALKQNTDRMMEIVRFIDDRWLKARALFRQTWIAMNSGNFEVARQTAQECLNIFETVGDFHMRAMVLGNQLAEIAVELGDYAEGKLRREQGLELLKQVGQVSHIALVHGRLGFIAFCMNDYAAAAHHYCQGLKILADHGGFVYHQFDALLDIADFWAAQRYTELALELLIVVLYHHESVETHRNIADQKLRHLQAQVAPDTFADVQARVQKRELKVVVDEMIVRLSQPIQIATPYSVQFSPDSLTERELEILQALADGLNSREIAEQLVLSVATIRWYLKHIYGKLDAHSRSQAIARARELRLLV